MQKEEITTKLGVAWSKRVKIDKITITKVIRTRVGPDKVPQQQTKDRGMASERTIMISEMQRMVGSWVKMIKEVTKNAEMKWVVTIELRTRESNE